ncbi:XdhC/CoxI family protein [bacterium]|nr:XdhC/CoxI family protein [bacterium]
MRETMIRLIDDLSEGHSRVVCQVIETRGSTPQKAGAYMVVADDGRQWGTLGGGCVENEVKTKSLMTLAAGGRSIASYVLDHDYAWADGLICGGRMVIVSERVVDRSFADYARAWVELDAAGFGFREAIVQKPGNEAAPQAEPGHRFLIDHKGNLAAAWPVVPSAESLAIASAANVSRNRPVTEQGLSVIEWPARIQLLIVGAGHVGQAVAELAARADFEVAVADDRAQFANMERFPTAKSFHVGPFEETLTTFPVTSRTYALIVTRGHGHDQEAVGLLADTPAAYVGLIGSRRKIRMIMEALAEQGVPKSALARVKAPIGLPIGSQSVFEIAVSVVAELIAWRNAGEAKARSLGSTSYYEEKTSAEISEAVPAHFRAEVGP